MNNVQKLMRKLRKRSSEKSTSAGRRGKGLRHSKRRGLTKKAKIWIAVGGTLGVFLLAGIVMGVVWFKSQFSYEYTPITKDPEQLGIVEPPKGAEEITNIALFGIDSRKDNYRGLSDTMMIISINPKTGSIKLVSIMRDSLVKVDGHGYQKINAAYSLGGPELAIKTLNQTYRLNIKDYATVDFVGMAEIVDAVGGVEVELAKHEVYHVNTCITELAATRGLPEDFVTKAGVQTLNGVQAVGFSRVRNVPTINGTRDDFGRTERQRLVMSQLFQKALDLPITQYPSLIKAMLPYIQTSMGYDDIFQLAKILKADSVSLQQNRIPMDNAVISSGFSVPYIGSCVYYDLEFAGDLLNAFFFDDIPFEDYVAEHGVRKNPWYGSSGGASKPSTNTQTGSSGGTTGVTTDTGSQTDGDTDSATSSGPSVSTSLPILPSTGSTGSTGSSSGSGSDTTDGGTLPDTDHSGTEDRTDTDTGSTNTSTDTHSSQSSGSASSGFSGSQTTDSGASGSGSSHSSGSSDSGADRS